METVTEQKHRRDGEGTEMGQKRYLRCNNGGRNNSNATVKLFFQRKRHGQAKKERVLVKENQLLTWKLIEAVGIETEN